MEYSEDSASRADSQPDAPQNVPVGNSSPPGRESLPPADPESQPAVKPSDDRESAIDEATAAGDSSGSNEDAAQRRFVLLTGIVFLSILTCQYLMRAFDRPEPLPWERGAAFQDFQIDINTATAIEWTQLEGIGPSLAHRIVAYRKIHGSFQSIEELDRVEGIGPTTLDRIRPRLTIRHAHRESQQQQSPGRLK